MLSLGWCNDCYTHHEDRSSENQKIVSRFIKSYFTDSPYLHRMLAFLIFMSQKKKFSLTHENVIGISGVKR